MKLDPALDPCLHCGACLSFCAWDMAENENLPAGPELCRDCQVCYRICPRLPHDKVALLEDQFPSAVDSIFGRYIDAFTVHTRHKPAGAQDGGLVSQLAAYMLNSGDAEAILVTGRDGDWMPASLWVTNTRGVFGAAGSKYSTAPALSILQEGLEQFDKVALILLPCQSAAVARLKSEFPEWGNKISLTIGLFCSESFYHEGLVRMVEEKLGRPLNSVERFDITRGRFTARAGDDQAEWRMKELHGIAWPICLACQDLTAEYADISIGSVGSGEGANTAIVRSQSGMALMRAGEREELWTLSPVEMSGPLEKLIKRKRGNPDRISDPERALYGRGSVRGNWKRRRRKTL